MSNFRDFLFNRDPSAVWALTLAMTGVRMGERLLLVGDDAPLFALLASKVGLTGHAAVVVGSEEAAVRVDAAAGQFGVLIEDIRRSALPDIPVEDGAFDAAVVNAGSSFLALGPAHRDGLAEGIYRALRVAGRLVIVEGQPPRLFGLKRPHPVGLDQYRANGGAARILESAGFKPVRVLAEREGQRFTEGIKTN
jgi:hypothetical protein